MPEYTRYDIFLVVRDAMLTENPLRVFSSSLSIAHHVHERTQYLVLHKNRLTTIIIEEINKYFQKRMN